MGCMACTEPQCLWKGTIYITFYLLELEDFLPIMFTLLHDPLMHLHFKYQAQFLRVYNSFGMKLTIHTPQFVWLCFI